VPQSDVDSLQLTGVFTGLPDPQRGCPGVGIQGYAGVGGPVNDYTASNQPMWDISNTTTWIKGNHSLTFGANYAGGGSRGTLPTTSSATGAASTSASPAAWLRTSCSATTGRTASASSSPGLSRGGPGGQPARVQLDVLRPVHPGRVEGQLQAHLEPGPPLRLPQRALRDKQPHGLAELELRPGRTAGGRPTLAPGGIVDGAYYQEAGRRSPDNPTATRSSLPGSASRTGRAIRGIPSSGAATESSTIPPSCARSTAPRISIRTSAVATTPDPRPDGAAPDDGPALPELHRRRGGNPAANTFLAVSQSPEPKNPYVQQWSLGVQRQLSRTTTPS